MPEQFLGEDSDQPNLRLRITLVLTAIVAIVVLYTIIYRWAMITYGGTERSLVQSAQVVIESLTTAGFGGDTDAWRQHDVLAGLVIAMNLSGVLLVFLALPLFAVPMFRRAMDTAPPTESDLTDHIVICGHSAMDDVLCEELEAQDIPYLFVDTDPDEVERLNERGIDAIYGNAERIETLSNANVEHARALVADLDDETNPTVILSAQRVNPDLRIVSVVQNRDAVPHHKFAGADEVVVSKQSLGESLAMRSMQTVSERFHDALGITSTIDFSEYLVEEGSELDGQTLAEVDAFDERSITVIGGWFGARFLISPLPTTEISENTILLVAGDYGDLTELGLRRLPSHHGHPDRVLVCGYGDVGRAATEELRNENIEVTVVDQRDIPAVDVVGDITSGPVLRRAAIHDARAIVLAIDSDPAAIYSSILIKHVAPGIEIITRANDAENVWKLYNAGADYVLSLPEVTGEILAATLIGEEEILTPHDDFEFGRMTTPALVGQTLSEADIRNRTGCTVVGVERDDELFTDIGPTFQIEDGDILIAAGSENAVERFRELAGT